MDLVSEILAVPVAPVRMLVAVARILQDEAERELNDPSRVRREIEDIEAAQGREEVPDEVADEQKRSAVSRLVRADEGEGDAQGW